MKRILYISDLDHSAPLFHSQVIPHINELKKSFDITLIILSRGSSNLAYDEDRYFYYRSVTGDYFYYLAWLNFMSQRKTIKSVIRSLQVDMIYSRGVRGGLVGCFLKKEFFPEGVVLLNDMRGVPTDGMRDNFIVRTILNQSNRIVFRHANILFVVSSYLRQKVCLEYNFNINNAFVFSTFVPDDKFDYNEENRIRIRKELGYTPKDVVIVYSGNLAKWQNVDTILAAFRLTSNKDLKLMILTQDDVIHSMVKRYDLTEDRVKVMNLKYDEIERYYHAADYGILIRDNIDTNKSAAPTKFSEYVNSGLSVIVNSIDADYIRIFKDRKLAGILLDKKEDLVNCFDNMTPSSVQRNVLKINTLSDIVRKQKEVLNNFRN